MITIGAQKEALTCTLSEPPIGIEPMTYALRGGFRPSTTVQWVTPALLARLLVPPHVQSHAELLLADPLAQPGHHSVAFATFTTPRPSTSSGSNAPPRLTCLDGSKRPLTWGTVSRQFSLILVPS